METFAPATLPSLVPADPTKHVNFVPGMVLGVDDFRQEFAYHAGRDQWLARDLLGYGTVWGLGVSVDMAGDPRLVVAPGVALSPCGRLVCVTPAQCADLNEWLTANEHEVELHRAAAPGPLALYLVVCPRECATDEVPIPGEPCRSEDDLMAPSRLADDFKLELRFDPPALGEEEAVRALAGWLRRLATKDGSGASEKELLDELRKAVHVDERDADDPALPGRASLRLDDPPNTLKLGSDELPERLRAALRVWTTEIRPRLRVAGGADCGCGGGGDCGCGCGGDCGCVDLEAARAEPCSDAVLLGRVELPVVDAPGGGAVVADAGPVVDDADRPYLLSARMLQELMLKGGGTGGRQGPQGEKGDRGETGDPGLGRVVAAGAFDGKANIIWERGDLKAVRVKNFPLANATVYLLSWPPPADGTDHDFVPVGTVQTNSQAPAYSMETIDVGEVAPHVPAGTALSPAVAVLLRTPPPAIPEPKSLTFAIHDMGKSA